MLTISGEEKFNGVVDINKQKEHINGSACM
jgi:hypothetical protein